MSLDFFKRSFLLVTAGLAILCAYAAAQEGGEDVVVSKSRKLYSKILSEERTVWVHLPRDYDNSGRKYPVFYKIGDYLAMHLETASVLDQMSSQMKSPWMILVEINHGLDRYRDMLPVRRDGSPGGAPNFLNFLEKELIPFIESNYRTEDYRILMSEGRDAGSMFGLYLFLEKPELFDAHIMSGPPLGDYTDYYVKKVKTALSDRDPLDSFLYISYRLDERKLVTDYLPGVLDLIKANAPSGLEYHFLAIGEKTEHFPTPYVGAALEALFPDFEFKDFSETMTLSDITSHYSSLSERYGFSVEIPEHALVNLSDIKSSQGKHEEVIDVCKIIIEKYPNSTNAWFRSGFAYKALGNKEMAIKCFKRTLELFPQATTARRALDELEKQQ